MQKKTNLIKELKQTINSGNYGEKIVDEIKNTEKSRKLEKSKEKPKVKGGEQICV